MFGSVFINFSLINNQTDNITEFPVHIVAIASTGNQVCWSKADATKNVARPWNKVDKVGEKNNKKKKSRITTFYCSLGT